MTSTTQGIFNDRNSSRVLRPPGGGSSNIFGCTTDEPKPTKTIDAAAVTEPVSNDQQNEVNKTDDSDNEETENKKADEDNDTEAGKEKTVDSAIASAKERELIAKKSRAGGSGFNPITGEPLNDSKGDDASKQNARVRQPPGGASTKLW